MDWSVSWWNSHTNMNIVMDHNEELTFYELKTRSYFIYHTAAHGSYFLLQITYRKMHLYSVQNASTKYAI